MVYEFSQSFCQWSKIGNFGITKWSKLLNFYQTNFVRQKSVYYFSGSVKTVCIILKLRPGKTF